MKREDHPAAERAAALPAATWAALDETLRGWVDAGELPCVSVAAFHRDRLLHRYAYGVQDLATGAPVADDSIFAIYSMTKPVTAVAMMILHDRGLWRPHDPIARLLPEFAGLTGPAGAPLAAEPTVEQLLTHTAGFAYGLPVGGADAADLAYLEAGLWEAADLADFSQRLSRLPLAHAPGETWRYSLSMDLQGALIERLTGRSLGDFMQAEIFAPLGMVDTGFSVPAGERRRLAKVYTGLGGDGLVELAHPRFGRTGEPPSFASGGGGLYSTVDDYSRFAQMLLARGAFQGGRILSPEAVDMMTTNRLPEWMMEARLGWGPQQFKPGFGYGYNGAVFTDPQTAGVSIGAGAYQWDGASSVWFWVDPVHAFGFVAMTNRIMQEGLPPFQATSQNVVGRALEALAAQPSG